MSFLWLFTRAGSGDRTACPAPQPLNSGFVIELLPTAVDGRYDLAAYRAVFALQASWFARSILDRAIRSKSCEWKSGALSKRQPACFCGLCFVRCGDILLRCGSAGALPPPSLGVSTLTWAACTRERPFFLTPLPPGRVLDVFRQATLKLIRSVSTPVRAPCMPDLRSARRSIRTSSTSVEWRKIAKEKKLK